MTAETSDYESMEAIQADEGRQYKAPFHRQN